MFIRYYFSIGFLLLLFTLFNNVNYAKAIDNRILSPTPTPKAAPWPTMVFTTGDSNDTIQYYAPKKNELCLTWNPYTGFIGQYSIPSGNNFLILKFTDNQTIQAMRIVWCEDATNHTPEERLSFTIQSQPCCYFWDRSVIRYIGANMQEVTLTLTPSETATSTSTPTATLAVTWTPTLSSTRTQTRSRTPTATEVLGPNIVIPQGVSTLFQAKSGNVCFGEKVGGQSRVITEFVEDFDFGIEISGGGCFTSNNYSLSQILRYLESRGVKYNYTSLPKPTLTPSRTLVPTITIVPYLPIGIQSDKTKNMLLQPGTICWGYKVERYEYKVVKYHQGTKSPIWVTNGGCHLSSNLSAEDVFNYLRRRYKLPLNGFVDIR